MKQPSLCLPVERYEAAGQCVPANPVIWVSEYLTYLVRPLGLVHLQVARSVHAKENAKGETSLIQPTTMYLSCVICNTRAKDGRTRQHRAVALVIS
jgi:hypothetical protein